MKLSEILTHFYNGKKIRRKDWDDKFFIDAKYKSDISINSFDMLKDDWEVVEEPQLKKKVKLYFYTHKESLYDTKILSRVLCSTKDDYGLNEWVRLPNLDQEIEIDGE